jgi:hypothetical protein
MWWLSVAFAAVAGAMIVLAPPCVDLVTVCTAPVIACGLWYYGTALLASGERDGDGRDTTPHQVQKFALASSAVTVLAATEGVILWFRGSHVDLLTRVLLGYSFWTWAGLELWRSFVAVGDQARFYVGREVAWAVLCVLWSAAAAGTTPFSLAAVVATEWVRYMFLLKSMDTPNYCMYGLPLATFPMLFM